MSLTGDLVPGAPAAPIAFTGCEMQSAAAGQGAPHGHDHAHPRRREVVVNGKRIKTIDVHAHCCVPKAMALIIRAAHRSHSAAHTNRSLR